MTFLPWINKDWLDLVKRGRKVQTFRAESGSSYLREMVAYKRSQIQWFDFWHFEKLVTEERWSLTSFPITNSLRETLIQFHLTFILRVWWYIKVSSKIILTTCLFTIYWYREEKFDFDKYWKLKRNVINQLPITLDKPLPHSLH